jgi:hypothetical protein
MCKLVQEIHAIFYYILYLIRGIVVEEDKSMLQINGKNRYYCNLLATRQMVGRLNCCWASPVIPGFSVLEIQDQDLYSLLDMYVFRNGVSSSSEEGLVFLCRRYVCCTIATARVYTRCDGVQVTMDSVHLLSLHYTK